MRWFFIIVLGIGAFVGIIEKTTRYTYDSRIFNMETVPVRYVWDAEPWDSALADAVNIGAHRKWFGLKRYNAAIRIPYFQAHSAGRYAIRRESITAVSPVTDAMYNCSNNFWTVTCVGPFSYRVDPRNTYFESGGSIVTRPPENWLKDVRQVELTVYKYF